MYCCEHYNDSCDYHKDSDDDHWFRFSYLRHANPPEAIHVRQYKTCQARSSHLLTKEYASSVTRRRQGSVLLYVLGLLWFAWTQIVDYPEVVRWVGVLLALAAIPALAWVHRALGRQYSPCLQIKQSHSLITDGPYARVRHPMYTVLSTFSLGMSLVTANLLTICFAILVIIPFPFVARKEEHMMLEEFGDEYREYMKRSGRFFPKRSKNQKGEEAPRQST
jgi:protein-S-isoprenylcysteine O-methyltransferase Ste14